MHIERGGAGEACVVCGSSMRRAFEATVLGRHSVQYWSCPACGHFRTEKPYWLEQAYTRAIAGADTGIVLRNLAIARQLACVLHACFDPDATYLDTAGGTGLLTRLMRDIGFNFRWEDSYCDNVMAHGFEAAPDSGGYEAVTAFEALEHMEDPLGFVRSCLTRSSTGTLIFTTELFEGGAPAQNWWYLAFPTGQHISFFSHRTLERIAAQVGARLLSHAGLHMVTRKDVSDRHYRKALDKVGRGRYESVLKDMISRTGSDHELMLRKALGVTVD